MPSAWLLISFIHLKIKYEILLFKFTVNNWEINFPLSITILCKTIGNGVVVFSMFFLYVFTAKCRGRDCITTLVYIIFNFSIAMAFGEKHGLKLKYVMEIKTERERTMGKTKHLICGTSINIML